MYSSSSDQVESSAAHISPSSLPHEEGSLQKCLDLERCSLWRCLVRAAVPAAMQKKKAIMRHGLVHAVFSALDGQYRYATDGPFCLCYFCCHLAASLLTFCPSPSCSEARVQLLEVHAAILQAGGAGSRKLVQVLTLLVGVLLEQGHLQEAERFSNQVRAAHLAGLHT